MFAKHGLNLLFLSCESLSFVTVRHFDLVVQTGTNRVKILPVNNTSEPIELHEARQIMRRLKAAIKDAEELEEKLGAEDQIADFIKRQMGN